MSSSSSSSSSSSEDVNGNTSRTRGDDFGAPSLTRRRANNEIWPGPFVEDLLIQVAIDASRSNGRLAAARALFNVFEVCSTWLAVSRSDPLWHRLTMIIWGRTDRIHVSWREEYMYRHLTARNFRNGTSFYDTLHFDPAAVEIPDGLTCRCLALSDTHLACGFADGTVRLFDLATRHHVGSFHPHHRDRLGRFSRAVAGIIITDPRIIFATLDGDIHVAIIDGDPLARTAHLGNVVNDGVLIDFTGSGRWWVGLYAGVPGRAIHVWDGNTEQQVYGNIDHPLDENTDLTDPEAVMGWHTLTELTDAIGRVRVTSWELAIACTSVRYIVLDLRNLGGDPVHDRACRRGLTVTSFDTNNEAFVMVDNRGWAFVRRVDTLELVRRFDTGQMNVNVTGCMNQGCALVCAAGVITVWEIEREIERGQLLYSLNENVGGVNAMVADDRHVAVAGSDTRIHLWDFGAQWGN